MRNGPKTLSGDHQYRGQSCLKQLTVSAATEATVTTIQTMEKGLA